MNNSFPIAVSMNTPSMVHPNITFGFKISHSDRWPDSVRIGRYQSVMFVLCDILFLLKLYNLGSLKTKLKWTFSWKCGYFKRIYPLFKRSGRPNGKNHPINHKIRHKLVDFAHKHAESAWFFASLGIISFGCIRIQLPIKSYIFIAEIKIIRKKSSNKVINSGTNSNSGSSSWWSGSGRTSIHRLRLCSCHISFEIVKL